MRNAVRSKRTWAGWDLHASRILVGSSYELPFHFIPRKRSRCDERHRGTHGQCRFDFFLDLAFQLNQVRHRRGMLRYNFEWWGDFRAGLIEDDLNLSGGLRVEAGDHISYRGREDVHTEQDEHVVCAPDAT